MKSIVDKFKLA